MYVIRIKMDILPTIVHAHDTLLAKPSPIRRHPPCVAPA
jgi:hypothetical protein